MTTTRPLAALLRHSDPISAVPDVEVSGITTDSRAVQAGDLFVAVRGTEQDGHEYIRDAVQLGAGAIVSEENLESLAFAIPWVQVGDTRRVLAELAAAWHGHPAERLSLVGITGTLGKTTVLSMLEEILVEADIRTGTVGSLGVRLAGETIEDTGHTAPGPLELHAALARLEREHCDVVAMEVTSHALAQDRVHGLRYQLGIFTNLVPLEHQDYHGSFAEYAEVKSRFVHHIAESAPLVYNADDRAVSALIEAGRFNAIGVGTESPGLVRVREVRMTSRGTRFALSVEGAIESGRGGRLGPVRIEIATRLLGGGNVVNAALAATAALTLGVSPERIASAISRIPAPRRRMEMIHQGSVQILDDTVGHPDSITAVFGVVEALNPVRLHIAFAVRGLRGAEINAQTAATLGTWAKRVPPATLIVTRGMESADERNIVSDNEMDAFTEGLEHAGVSFEVTDRLDAAVRGVLEQAGPEDLILFLGAQGMDAASTIAAAWFAETNASAAL